MLVPQAIPATDTLGTDHEVDENPSTAALSDEDVALHRERFWAQDPIIWADDVIKSLEPLMDRICQNHLAD